MPNQRDKNKSHLQGWIDSDVKRDVMLFCERNGITPARFIELAVKEELAKYEARKGRGVNRGEK